MSEKEIATTLAAHQDSPLARAYDSLIDNWLQSAMALATAPGMEPHQKFEAVGRLAELWDIRNRIDGLRREGRAYLDRD
jgi:hypothetical protein